jgi:hypothetical protein
MAKFFPGDLQRAMMLLADDQRVFLEAVRLSQ